MSKIVGYILGLIGIAIVAASYPSVRTALKISTALPLSDTILLIIGAVVLLIGAYLAFKKSGAGGRGQITEVPIYHGDRIVGYRRE